MTSEWYDFVVVGAGTAGAIVGRRLSDTGATTLLLEAGRDVIPGAEPDDITDVYPRSYYNSRYAWPGLTAWQGVGADRSTPYTQARLVGGGSNLMGMVALRGHPGDYESWAEVAGADWGWERMREHFRAQESDQDFGGPEHGTEGPLVIHRPYVPQHAPFSAAIGEAAEAQGFVHIKDLNGEFGDGWGPLPLSATPDRRVSASSAYLDRRVRTMSRSLTLSAWSTVTRLEIDRGRCRGVWVGGAGRAERFIGAGHVVVCAGAVFSPTLLMRSGIGPAGSLKRQGIEVVADRPGVGRHLMNHPVVYLGTHLRHEARQAAQLRSGFTTALRFSSAELDAQEGELQLLVLNKSSWHGLGAQVAGLGVCLMAPESRGRVRLDPRRPEGHPRVEFDFLRTARDRDRMLYGFATAAELMAHQAVAPLRHELFVTGYTGVVRQLNKPGRSSQALTRLLSAFLDSSQVTRRLGLRVGTGELRLHDRRTRDLRWQRRALDANLFGTFHVAGTCRLGSADDDEAVVTPDTAVVGVDGLSVIDASIMPGIPRANTFLATVAVAHHGVGRLLAAS